MATLGNGCWEKIRNVSRFSRRSSGGFFFNSANIKAVKNLRLRSRLLIFIGVYMSSYALFQHVNWTFNCNTLYDFDEPFEAKEYHTALITGHGWFKYQIPIDKLITMAANQGVSHFVCEMALGTDQVVAEILIRRKLKWTAVIPGADDHKLWKPRQPSPLQEFAGECS